MFNYTAHTVNNMLWRTHARLYLLTKRRKCEASKPRRVLKNRGKTFRFNVAILAIKSATAASTAVIRESSHKDCPSMQSVILAWQNKHKVVNIKWVACAPQTNMIRYVAMTHPAFIPVFAIVFCGDRNQVQERPIITENHG